MFYFDPNNITGEDWRRLGIPERLTQTILHYVDKGGRFRTAKDLKKIYGLPPGEYARLLPFVRFSKPKEDSHYNPGNFEKSSFAQDGVKNKDSYFREGALKTGTGFLRTEKKFEITDINDADSAAWSRFPGIGSRLASRIVHFRQRLGGFYQVDQVGETFGLADSSFQKIKSFLRLNVVSVFQLDINEASRETLQAHPYIRWQLAKSIIDYRLQHGKFISVDELLQLARMDQQKFEKLKPYLTVNR
jgi:DNA uptake protein ComE-like DNA-binding protein